MIPSVSLPIDAIRRASGDSSLVRVVCEFYLDVEEGLVRDGWACRTCGRCCRFTTYDHRLFVTPLELSYLLAHAPIMSPIADQGLADCPFQITDGCGVYPYRTLGCRLFDCRPAFSAVFSDFAELWHKRLVEMHQTLQVPYCYVEWADALRSLHVR